MDATIDPGPRTDASGTAPAPSVRAMTRPQIGQLGEDIAADYLRGRGWRLIARNHRIARGELDIIALDGSTLVFVEVKTRRTILSGVPQAAVDQRKLRRIRHLAGCFLLEHSPPHRDIRVDVVAVMVADGQAPEIQHVVGVGA